MIANAPCALRSLRFVLVFAFFFLLAFIALHQPILHVATHMPGDGVTDYYHFHWNYGWIHHALTNGLSIYQTNFVLFPFVSGLAYHTLAPFWYPLWALIEPLAGTFAAFNAIFVIAFTLSGVCFYALLRREGVSRRLALVGGAMLELSPLLFFAAEWSMTSLIAWFWLPLALLTWGEITRSQAWRTSLIWSGLFGFTLWAMQITDLQYALYLAFLIMPYGIWTLWRSRQRVRLVTSGVIALSVALVLLWIGGTLPAILSFDRAGLAPTPADRAVAIPFPLGYFWHTENTNVPLGAVILPLTLLSIASIIKRRGSPPLHVYGEKVRGWELHFAPAWLWLITGIIPLMLSVGASIQIGTTTIPMLYRVFHDAFGGMFRYPERFGVVILIAFTLFSLKTLTVFLSQSRKWQNRAAFALMLVVLLDSRVWQSVPIQLQPTRYALYEHMAREPYEYVVLEVPTGGSSGEGIVGITDYSALQFYGLTHGKRMINGHISRVNTSHYTWMNTDDPMMAWLGQRRYIDQDAVRAQLEERIFSYPIGYIVIHTNLIDPYAPTLQEIVGWFNAQSDLLCPPTLENSVIAYRTRWHPDGCDPRTPPRDENGRYIIDVGSADDQRYLGWGYYPPETIFDMSIRWLGETENNYANVYVDLPPGSYRVELIAQSFYVPRWTEIWIDGLFVYRLRIMPDILGVYSVDIPATQIGGGEGLTLTINYDDTISPDEVGQNEDQRDLSILLDSITFTQLE